MQQPTRIAPSILSADFSRLGEEVRRITEAGADYVHIDVMDGHFVPNISFGPLVMKSVRSASDLPFDVHLMISPVDAYVQAFVEAGADIVTIHPEAGPHVHRTLQLIKGYGRRAGLALNPGTPLSAVENLLGLVDLVLVMSVNPGFGGQKFIEAQLSKIEALRRMIDATGRTIDLEVDGGINAETASRVISAGADVLVAGTAVFGGEASGADDTARYARNIRALRGHGE